MYNKVVPIYDVIKLKLLYVINSKMVLYIFTLCYREFHILCTRQVLLILYTLSSGSQKYINYPLKYFYQLKIFIDIRKK